MINNNTVKLADLIRKQEVLSVDGMKSVMDVIGILDVYDRRAVGVTLGERFVGIFSYADFVHRVVREGRHPKQTSVIEVTNLEPVAVSPACSVREALDLMSRHSYSHLPVLSSDRHLLGIVSQDDLWREITKKAKYQMGKTDYLHAHAVGKSYNIGYCGTATKM